MNFSERHNVLIKRLYDMSNPVIKYRIDKEIYQKKNINIGNYVSEKNEPVKYWLNIWDSKTIHGSKDEALENSIAKLLEFGCTKQYSIFNEKFSFLIEDRNWVEIDSFSKKINQIVIYPFLIRAGYHTDKNLNSFFNQRLELIEKTIDKYGYNIFEASSNKKKKSEDEFIFKFTASEALPSIYDLYAFAFYPKNNEKITKRIEKIITYILDERFQKIPEKTYVLDEDSKRYYAFGNVYHACFPDYRKLLSLYLLSHFKTGIKSSYFMNGIEVLLGNRLADGFFEFNKDLLKEKRNMYYIYHGSHMGLGELSKNKNSRKIESTFWMLKILSNIENK